MQNSPDIVFSTDAEGRFTFLSDAIERVTGHRAADVLGQHFSALIDQTSGPVAGNRWAELVAEPDREQQAALVLVGVDGRRAGRRPCHRLRRRRGELRRIQGATRDVSDQAVSRTSCGGRPVSSRRVRSGRTSHASCTTR